MSRWRRNGGPCGDREKGLCDLGLRWSGKKDALGWGGYLKCENVLLMLLGCRVLEQVRICFSFLFSF